MSQVFLFSRFRRALLNDVLRIAKPALIGTAALLGITALVYLTNFESPTEVVGIPIAQRLYAIYLLIVGLVLTSMSFQDMHHPLERYRYLMLPISNLERYLSRYLMTGPLFALYVIVAFTIMDWAGNLLTDAFRDVREPLFNQFSDTTFGTIYIYLGLHAIAFTGAICFRSYALIKTVLAVLLVHLSVAAAFYIALRIFFFDAFSWTSFHATGSLSLPLLPMFAARWMNAAVAVLFALWTLYIAYRCLRAHEVQDEL